MESHLLEGSFTVFDTDIGGKKFDGVTRLHCKSESLGMEMILDIYSEVYPVEKHEELNVVITKTLRNDGLPDDGEYKQLGKERSIADSYDYVMHGKLFRVEKATEVASVYASFGGLIMNLKGRFPDVNFEEDSNVYLLMSKK